MRALTLDRPWATLLLAAWVTSLAGCAAASWLKARPGTDLFAVQAGAPRQRIEEVLGAPLRQWQTAAGITYCLYEFDEGLPVNVPAAIGVAVLDVAGGGFMTLLKQIATDDASPDCRQTLRGCGDRVRMIVSYAADDTLIATFADREELPADGKRRPR